MDVTLETLSKWFVDTLSPDKKTRLDAEKCLTNAADQPGYALALLRLASEPTVHDGIRKAAAVHFKNHLRARWAPAADPPGGRHTVAPSLSLPLIPDPEKEQIKALLVGLMLATSPDVQSQLSAALAVVGRHDFPRSWPSLLPELVASLGRASDYASINGILKTANTIFKKFRYTYRTNDLMLDLKYCLQGFQAPLLEVFLKTSKLIAASLQSPPEVLRPLIESQRLCCRIFYSLNFQDIPEFFEDHMKEWMTEFESYLTMAFPDMGNDKKGVPVLDRLRAAICDNISLYMERYEEEFRDYLNRFASAVWNLLLGVSTGPARDKLTVTAIKFLTTVSTSVHHAIFSDPGTLTQICESIIIPNVQLRDEDEEQFEFDHVEYIRRDIEGSDLDTRRRIACELLKGIATKYREQVAQMVVGQIENMLNLYNQNPVANWKKKDCAIYLLIALATRRAGGSSATTDLVNVDNFFATVIVPELRSPDVNGLPMLKADALKFFTTFRDQIQKSAELALIPDVIRFLGSESNVVHSYAANCIEKLLLVRDEGQPRYSSLDISPFLPVLMNNLFNALKFPNSQENPYVMKCIMRVFRVSDIGVEVAGICITSLTAILVDVCKNPKNPVFNHYLFEAIAALVRRSCERDPSLVQHFERSLFPVLQGILANDDSEFRPYTFQILAQLVELNIPPLPPSYMQLFEGLLNPEAWKRSGNVPGLVRLLQAYLQKAPHELNREGRLSQVLGIFNKLVSVSSTEELGFYVLNTVIENLSYDVVAPYFGHIWSTLFTRLQNNRTVKFVKSLVIFMSLFLIKYGHERLVDSINAVQPNIFGVILEQFWIPHLKMITGFIELKLTSVAATKLICECPALLNDSAALMWGKMLDGIITLIAQPEQERVEEEPDVPDIGENAGYSATFVHLYNAGKREDDPLKEVRDPKEFLVSSLARLSALSPGKYPIIIRDTVDNANQQYLHQFCGAYNHVIL